MLSMYTEPRFRWKCLASLIVKEAVDWACDNGYPSMTPHASKTGREVYSKLGWRRTWEMYLNLERAAVRNTASAIGGHARSSRQEG